MDKIYVADDNQTSRYFLKKVLSGAGYEVVAFKDGKELLDAFYTSKPDLIITDIKMPVIDGFELVYRIRKQNEYDHLPIIILSATYRDLSSKIKGLAQGANDYLTPPVNKEELIAKVRFMIRAKKMYEELQETKERYQAIFESTGTAILVVGDDTTILNANQEFEKISGYAVSQLIGKSWTKFVYQEDLLIMLNYHKARRKDPNTVPASYEVRLIDAKGDIRNAILLIGMMPDGKRSIISMNDITSRKKAEEQIRLHAAMMNNLAEGINLVGLDDLLIKWTNDRFAKMFGYDPGELVGKQVEILNAPTERTPSETRISIVDALKETGEWHGEVRNIKRDGTPFWCYASVSLFDHPEYGKVMVSVHTDITERKQAEEALQASEARYHLLVENANDSIIVVQDGRLKFANRITSELTGYSNQELISRPFPEFIHPDDRDMMAERYLRRLKGDISLPRYDFRLVTRDGSIKWIEIGAVLIDWEGRPASLNFLTDITERKHAEDALRDSEARFRTVMKGSPVIVAHIDRDLRYTWIYNPHPDFDPAFVQGKRDDEIAVNEGTRQLVQLKRQVIETGSTAHAEIAFPLSEGGRVYEITAEPLKDDSGMVIGATTVSFDITQRKQAEDALKQAHEQLEDRVARRTEELQKANLKLQELDQLKTIFIASMSHELRSPLSLIIGFTDIILQEISGEINQEQRRQFTLVKKNANHLLSLISDVLDINKVEAGKAEMIIEEFNLSVLSREVRDNFKVVADKKGLALSLESPPTLLLESDKRRTKQILVNLLSNALKFTDRGEIKIKIATKDQMVEMSVRDSGSGIKKEDMYKLFNAFSQIPNPGRIEEGTGLGLYLSKKNAHLLGGDILVESEPGKGSVFTLSLPLKYKDKV